MKKILVIDDDIGICNMLYELFPLITNCKVEIANNKNEFLQKIDSTKYDLICIDFVMPELSGTDLIKFIRSNNGPNSRSKIILITGHIDAINSVDKAFLKDIAIVNKPLVIDQILPFIG